MLTPLTLAEIQAAAGRLHGIAHHTPVVTSRTLNERTGCELFLKCEQFQRAGAFKFRGAYNMIAQLDQQARERGVIAFSSGNHAQGLALAAQLLGVPAIVCMPNDAPNIKVEATRGYGAEVRFYQRLTEDREAFTRALAQEKGLTLVPPYDHPQVMAGAGTAVLELLQEVPDLDTIIVPIGGGGLIAGSAIAAHGINSQIQVFGVEPHDADDTARSLRAGERVAITPPGTIADGLRITKPGALTFPLVQEHVKDVLLVSDDQIRDAIRFAVMRLKLIIEPSGAATLAAALAGRLPGNARRVGMIVSGGNIEPELLAEIMA